MLEHGDGKCQGKKERKCRKNENLVKFTKQMFIFDEGRSPQKTQKKLWIMWISPWTTKKPCKLSKKVCG